MGSVRESTVAETIKNLQEAEKTLAVVQSKKKDTLDKLAKLKIKPEDLDAAMSTLREEIATLTTQLAKKVKKANELLDTIAGDERA
jgi:predicted  nucleic acid-binding Zn-ribbon protein